MSKCMYRYPVIRYKSSYITSANYLPCSLSKNNFNIDCTPILVDKYIVYGSSVFHAIYLYFLHLFKHLVYSNNLYIMHK